MLSPQRIATITAEIEMLEYARKHCSDFGIQTLIGGWIGHHKMMLDSGKNPKHPPPNNNGARIPSKPSK
jgi:hypothetical protein